MYKQIKIIIVNRVGWWITWPWYFSVKAVQ